MVAKKFKLLSAFAAVALIVGACGNSGDDGDSTETTAGGETTTTADGSGGDRDTFVSLTGVPGVSDTEIVAKAIGVLSSNPLGTNILNAYADGVKAYFEWRNDEGGIYGRKLVLDEVIDDALAKNKDKATEVCAGGKTFATFVAPLLFSGATTLQECGMPTFSWGIHREPADNDYIFPSTAVTCQDCTSPINPWIASKLGVTKVASIGYGVSENSKVCAQLGKKSFEKYTPDIEVAYFDDTLAFGLPTGIAPQVSKMKEAGVELITTCIDLNGMKKLGEELQKQGMDDVILVHPNTYNQDFIKANAAIFEGDLVGVSFVPFEAKIDSETQTKFLEYTEKLGLKSEELTMVGWINADTFFTGLLAAGPEFSQVGVKDALRAITEYSAGGLIVPINLSTQWKLPTAADPTTHGYKQTCTNTVQIVGGVFEQWSGEAGKPFNCWPNPTDALEDPVATSFSDAG